MRGAPCPGCGRRVPETVATCLACGSETGDRLAPIALAGHDPAGTPAALLLETDVGSPGSRPGRGRRCALLAGAGLAVATVLSLLPDPVEPQAPTLPAAAVDFRHPPAAGALARAAEAAIQPGVVWPPPGPMRARQESTTVWTGSHMLMWRGPETGRPLDGSAYDSAARTWRSAAPAPIESRSHPAAIWDGREVLVWGGLSATGVPFADGAAYDPAEDTWRSLPPAPLDARVPLVAAWTGREVLVVGARAGAAAAGGHAAAGGDAAAYDPETRRWRRLAALPVPLGEAVAAWTGAELLVYGALAAPPEGADPAGGRHLARGAAYDPAADRWRILPVAPLSSPFLTAAWTGREFVAWDGARRTAAFNPRSGRWSGVGGMASRSPSR